MRTGNALTDRNLDGLATTTAAIAGKLNSRPQWIAPASLANGWVNYANTAAADPGSANGRPPVGYTIDSSYIVHLRGFIKSGTISNTATGTVFTLPAGYRPLYELVFPVASNDAFGEVIVVDNGDVRVNLGNAAWVSLATVSFLAEQ
jgi:hypothetical protein